LIDDLFNKKSFSEAQVYHSRAKKYEAAANLYKKVGFKKLKSFKKYFDVKL